MAEFEAGGSAGTNSASESSSNESLVSVPESAGQFEHDLIHFGLSLTKEPIRTTGPKQQVSNLVCDYGGADDRTYGRVLRGIRILPLEFGRSEVRGLFDIWTDALYLWSPKTNELLTYMIGDLGSPIERSMPQVLTLTSRSILDLGVSPSVFALEVNGGTGFLYLTSRSETNPHNISIFDIHNRCQKICGWSLSPTINWEFMSVNRYNGDVLLPTRSTAEIFIYSVHGHLLRTVELKLILQSTLRADVLQFSPFRAFGYGPGRKFRVLHATTFSNIYQPIIITEIVLRDDGQIEVEETRNVPDTSDDDHVEYLIGSDGGRAVVTVERSLPVGYRGHVYDTSILNILHDKYYHTDFHYQLIWPRALPEVEFPFRFDKKRGHLIVNICGDLIYFHAEVK